MALAMLIVAFTAHSLLCRVLLVTHDPRVEEIADRILWLEDGACATANRRRMNGGGIRVRHACGCRDGRSLQGP